MKKIDPERWKKMEALLDEALDLEPSEREAHVRAQAAGDDDLRDEVLRILAASAASESFLESTGRQDLESALARMASAIEEKSDDELGELTTAGPYRLIRKLGRGGMGQVYLGVRDDEAFKRYVAVKVIRRGMDTEDILKRFSVERRILASLTHPGIARLLDGGSTAEGVSYFVMEYVDGEPIDKYCDENRLSVKDRLALFQKVCSAVHYAHQNLIVHRDLKPGNILVTRDGDVKLLDFGIAKFLNPDLAGYTLPMTRTELRVMTPEYASPEQVRGNSLTTASDVYQLGILLYELLTGHRPFTFQTRVQGEIEKIILEQAPEKPSTMISRVEELKESNATLTPESVSLKRRTPLDRLRKQLSGDLDRIVLMALRKEMDRRYQSADQLLQDIQNYLAGRPVSAQADTLTYRVGKFVQRNKLGVSAAALVAVMLVLTTIVSIRSAIVTERQRHQIELEARKSHDVIDFMVDLFDKANPEYAQGRELTVRELLDLGAEDVQTRLEDHPEVQSDLMRVLSQVYAGLGEADAGMVLAEAALEREVDRFEDKDSPELASALYTMGVLKDDVGESQESIRYHEEALAMRRRLFGEQHVEVAQSLNDLGVTLYGLQAFDTTRVVWEQALSIRMEMLGPSHRDIAESLSNLGAVYGDLFWRSEFEDEELFEQAEEYYTRALDMTKRERGENHPFYASNLHNLGVTLLDRGILQEAENRFVEAIDKRTLIYGRSHNVTARSINMLGRVRVAQGRLGEAEPLFQESLDIHVDVLGPGNWIVGADHIQIAGLKLQQGQTEAAIERMLTALNIYQSAFPSSHPRIGRLGAMLGETMESEGRMVEAVRYFRLALNDVDPNEGIVSVRQASSYLDLARVLIATGRNQEALELIDAADAWLHASTSPDQSLIDKANDLRAKL